MSTTEHVPEPRTREETVGESPVGHPRRWTILAVVCLAVFVTVLDGTIVNVALPSLAIALGAVVIGMSRRSGGLTFDPPRRVSRTTCGQRSCGRRSRCWTTAGRGGGRCIRGWSGGFPARCWTG